MIAIPLLLLWVGYATGFWGLSLIKGWNLSAKQIFSPTGYYTGKWPPAQAGNAVIIPDGTQASLTDIALPAATTSSSTSSPAGSAPAPPAGVTGRAQIQKAAAIHGWGSGSQYSALLNIIARESGGNRNAYNPSGAYGIAQALGHGSGAEVGCGHNSYGGYGLSPSQAHAANCGNAWYQLVWMMNYIASAYGTPSKAWAEYCNHPSGPGGCWY